MLYSGSPDTFIALYNVAFNPASPTTGLVSCDDDAGAGYLSKIIPNLTTGTTYTLVVTAYNPNLTGSVTASFTPAVTFGAATGAVGGGAVSAPIDFNFNKKVETFATEVEVK